MMRVVGLVSGGKDSCHAMLWCRAEGHSVIALAHLQPSSGSEMDSMMYQSAGHEAVHLYASALDLPLFQGVTCGRAVVQGKSYTSTAGDEVEDLLSLLSRVQKAHPEVEAVCSGAILSDYQRVRVESVCGRLGLVSLSFLWRREQAGLLREMRDCGMRAMLVKVASFGLDRRHLGREVGELTESLIAMRETHQLNPCGEGGEFESFVLDSPLFRRPLRLVGSEEVVHSDDAFAPVAFLRLQVELGPEKEETEEKSGGLKPQDVQQLAEEAPELIGGILSNQSAGDEESSDMGFLTLSADGDDAEAAISVLMTSVTSRGLSAAHVLYTWLLLPDMGLYPAANKAYAAHFPAQHPPCRACLQVPLRRPRAAALLTTHSLPPDGSFLHVQSLSHWAPANIGPYSQAVALPGCKLLSGIVGLRPADLSVPPTDFQPILGLRHACLVAEATPGPQMSSLAAGVCYGVDGEVLSRAKAEFHRCVCPHVDGGCRCGRWAFVRVPALPKGTAVEWQTFVTPGTMRRFVEVEAAVREMGGGATWAIVGPQARSRVEDAAEESVVVIPVDGIEGEDGAVVCLLTI